MDEIWSIQYQMIVLSALNRDMMISQSFLHWSGSSRGRSDSGEGIRDDKTGLEWFQTGLSRSQSELVMNCKLDCKRLVSQFIAVWVRFFDYLDLFRTGLGPTCLIWKAETGLSRTLKHYSFCPWLLRHTKPITRLSRALQESNNRNVKGEVYIDQKSSH